MSWDKVVKVLAGVAGAIASVFGGWDTMLKVLCVFMIADYVSGWIVGIMGHSLKTENGRLNSAVGWKGIAKKCFILLMVLLAHYLDEAVGNGSVFRSMVIWFYIANEGLSVIENAALAGFPFPRSIKNALEQIKAKNDEPPAEDGFFEKEE